MKKTTLSFILIIFYNLSFSQGLPPKYVELIKQAEAHYQSKDYKKSAQAYSDAFKENGWKGTPNDRYNAACSWALANVPDSALFNLMRLANFMKFSDYNRVTTDSDLDILHEDKRWKEFL